ncbi:MAG: Gfo/Idh/MocA family oxidoreductase [Acidobacteria bacterium]|nr:Gfo/Idh/MocA family oxidoreductase [Acidobacteriota bacterium]
MSTSRREFLRPVAAAAAGGRKLAANDRIRIGAIGAGIMGTEDVDSSLKNGSELVAVADVYQGRLTRARERWGNHLSVTRDYREVLARPDIDAVLIATPDHWHSTITIDAMKAGKDVYCEKPMVQRIADGRAVVETARQTGRIVQVGSQGVSSVVYQKARDLLRAGAIGEVNLVEAWWDRRSAIGAWQYSIPPDATPDNIDWDRFLGRAPKRVFEPLRLFRWRNYQDYGTGVAGDLFVHLFSGLHFITGAIGPVRVFSTGGLRYWNDGRDVPDVLLGLFDYPKTGAHPAFNLALRVNFVDGGGGSSGFRFVGSEGTMEVEDEVILRKKPRDREPGQTADTFAKATEAAYLDAYRKQYPRPKQTPGTLEASVTDTFRAPAGYNEHIDHHRNFLEGVRTRTPVVEDAVFGFRAAGPALLSNVSYFEQRAVAWDPVTMTLKG